jgi:hypothetical protein
VPAEPHNLPITAADVAQLEPGTAVDVSVGIDGLEVVLSVPAEQVITRFFAALELRDCTETADYAAAGGR